MSSIIYSEEQHGLDVSDANTMLFQPYNPKFIRGPSGKLVSLKTGNPAYTLLFGGKLGWDTFTIKDDSGNDCVFPAVWADESVMGNIPFQYRAESEYLGRTEAPNYNGQYFLVSLAKSFFFALNYNTGSYGIAFFNLFRNDPAKWYLQIGLDAQCIQSSGSGFYPGFVHAICATYLLENDSPIGNYSLFSTYMNNDSNVPDQNLITSVSIL